MSAIASYIYAGLAIFIAVLMAIIIYLYFNNSKLNQQHKDDVAIHAQDVAKQKELADLNDANTKLIDDLKNQNQLTIEALNKKNEEQLNLQKQTSTLEEKINAAPLSKCGISPKFVALLDGVHKQQSAGNAICNENSTCTPARNREPIHVPVPTFSSKGLQNK